MSSAAGLDDFALVDLFRRNKASRIPRQVSHSAGDPGCQESVVPMCLESFSLAINVYTSVAFFGQNTAA